MKKNLTKVMAMGMVLTMLAGTTAFAEDTAEVTGENGAAIAEDGKLVVKEAAFISQSGKVVSVGEADENGLREVMMDNEQGGLRFMVASDTVIVNREDGAYLTGADLTEGMEVAVVYAANSPMGMSLPPYLGSVAAVVANADAGNMLVGHFSADLTDWVNFLKLNISEETSIQNLQGTKIRLTGEDVRNQDALVFYDVTTRSIPAQTTPSFVLLLTQAEEAEAEAAEGRAAEEKEVRAAIMVPLREAAEKSGYTVKWQGKAQPILLEKEGTSMEITIGSDTYVVEGDMVMKAVMPSELKDGVMYVSSDIFV